MSLRASCAKQSLTTCHYERLSRSSPPMSLRASFAKQSRTSLPSRTPCATRSSMSLRALFAKQSRHSPPSQPSVPNQPHHLSLRASFAKQSGPSSLFTSPSPSTVQKSAAARCCRRTQRKASSKCSLSHKKTRTSRPGSSESLPRSPPGRKKDWVSPQARAPRDR